MLTDMEYVGGGLWAMFRNGMSLSGWQYKDYRGVERCGHIEENMSSVNGKREGTYH